MANEQEKWHLPDPLRADLNPEILEAANAEQAALREKIGAVYSSRSPKDRELARAMIITEEYLAILTEDLQPSQLNELAEAYITLGRLDTAALVVADETLAGEIHDLQQALATPDDQDCQCGRRHAHAVREIYDMDNRRWITVMRCGDCGLLNAKDAPDHLLKARAQRAQIRNKYSGLHPLEAKKRMEADGLLRRT